MSIPVVVTGAAADPSAGGGVAGQLASLYLRNASGLVAQWVKTGALNTDWRELATTVGATGLVNGLGLTRTSATVITVAAGECRDSTNVTTIVLPSGTLDITVSGANGLDAGVEAADTLYAVWAIATATGASARLFSLSFTAPAMPAGFIYRRRIGSWYNDTGGDLIAGRQFGTGRERTVRFFAHRQVITDGLPTPEVYTAYTALGGASSSGMAVTITHHLFCNNAALRELELSEDGSNRILLVKVGDNANSRDDLEAVHYPDTLGRIFYRAAVGSGANLSYDAQQSGYSEWI
jgi:hypothetical protein